MAIPVVGGEGRTTKAPSGLSIARKGNKFTLTWKIADKDYGDGQYITLSETVYKPTVTASASLGGTVTSKAMSVNLSKYYPHTGKRLASITFTLTAKRKDYYKTKKIKTGKKGANGKEETKEVRILVVSAFSKNATKTMSFKPPSAPSLSETLDDELQNVCTYAWSLGVDDTSTTLFTDCQWESRLVRNSNVTKGSEIPWKSTALGYQTGTGGASGSIEITEDTTLLARDSYTRWFRVMARGAAGWSNYAYINHVFARPNQAKISKVTCKETRADSSNCKVEWKVSSPASHPIDRVNVQYSFATPDPNMSCPDAAMWSDAGTIRDTKENDALSFSVDQTVGLDQCMFVRVNTVHDSNTTYSVAKYAKVGYLTDPSGLTATAVDPDTYRATVTATNESAVADSYLAVYYITAKNPNGIIIGIIPNGETTTTVQCPHDPAGTAITFGVKAFVGSRTRTTRSDGVYVYAIDAQMQSRRKVTYGGSVPVAPTVEPLQTTDIVGTIRVTWSWTWQRATMAEISWADHEDAWESTDEPNTYLINNTHAAHWNISGLATGVTWYVRVRLASGTEDDLTYGAYSAVRAIDLSSTPVIPVLNLSRPVIRQNGTVTASWVFISTDSTGQAGAQVAELLANNTYRTLANVGSAQYVNINARKAGWQTGEEHSLAVRVTSASGRQTDWSDPVSVFVAEPLTCTISQTSLVDRTVVIDDTSYEVKALTTMPMTVTVTGAGQGTTMLAIERAETYHVDRPDETDIYGFEGETIASFTQTGQAQITIDRDDLIGRFDDGARYRLVATVQDGLGQTASATLPFMVIWAHQALAPEAEAEVDLEKLIVTMTPSAPIGALNGDTCDIYRLSVDRPQLIYRGAHFGETYVDPYPSIGEYGGYRFVTVTADGDYITEDNELAWIDVEAVVDSEYNIIDFERGQVRLQYNPDVSNSWKKDFKETKYLGGSVQGDWNPAVSRTASVASVALTASDQETIESMRRLATSAGICHVRTKDGSSYAADVQVSESYAVSNGHKLVSFSLTITRVDTEVLDAMTLAEWNALHQEE